MSAQTEPRIIQDTASWVAIEKPPGLVMHDVPGNKHAGQTLVDWLRTHVTAIAENFPTTDERPGIVHRLDEDTSGIVLVAKTSEALTAFQDQFRDRTTEKIYWALAVGDVAKTGTFVGQIVREQGSTQHRVKQLVFSWQKQQAKSAETTYTTLKRYTDQHQNVFSLVELKPKTGRTHQLRTQLLDNGTPILGDQTYTTKQGQQLSDALGLHRQFLHAVSLSFDDPSTRERVTLASNLPADLEDILKKRLSNSSDTI